jgi:hypothetical protein
MTIIYSDKEVNGLSGAYIAPFRFDGVVKGITVVYTDDAKIAKAYSGIADVKPITVKATKSTK